MKKETNSKDNGFELDDFWGFADANTQNKKNTEEDDWSFDDLFAAKEEREAARLEEQRIAQERAAAREATRRQIEAEFAAKKKAEEEAAAKVKEEALKKAEAEAAAQAQARLEAEAAARRAAEAEAAEAAAKAEELRLAQAAESEKERVRRQAEEKAKMSQTRRKPVRMEDTEEVPGREEFSDTATMSLNRLKPEIRLTSVEPPIPEEPGARTSEYDNTELEYEDEYEYEDGEYADKYEYEDGEYDDEYEYEDGEYDDEYEYEDGEYDDEYEYEDGEYDDEYEYEDGEYDDEYEYEDGEYDDEYDYEAEEDETEQPAGAYVPLSQPAQPAAEYGRKKEYGTDEDWQALARDDEDEDKSKKPLIIGIVCGVIVLLLVVIIVWAFNRGDGSETVNMNSSMLTQQKTVTGVITGMDPVNQTILVYDAKSGKETSLDVKEMASLLSGLAVGDVVDVEYEAGVSNAVSKLIKSQSTITLNDVKNAAPNGSIIDINGHTYYIDDKLVCLYQGQAFDMKMISKNTTYNAVVLDDHIYTIVVTYATGTLKIENLSEYVNATIVLVPATGDRIEMLITGNMEPIDIQEGSVEIQIKNDKETLYTGKTFISAGKENTLKLPSVKDQKGKVVFSSNIDEEMTILVNGQEYNGTDEIELAYGEYTGIFKANGYEDVEQQFKISQPYQQVNVTFEENTTLVSISTSLWGVSLYVDGVYQGELEGNSIEVRLAPGAHSITCTRTGYYDQHQSIMILEGMDDQMLYFSGFEAIEEEESSTTTEESSTTPESSTTTEESSTPVEESSDPVEESQGGSEETTPTPEGSDGASTGDDTAGAE